VLAFSLEMYGAPFSLYLVMWLFGKTLPHGIFWGHTLSGSIGMTGHYIYLVALVLGGALIVAGWAKIYRDYWSREDGEGRLVKEGLYRFVRHPQYAGFILISVAVLFEWATIPLLLMWPFLVTIYYRLARREEAELEKRFGEQWREYAAATGMFLPRLRLLVGGGRRNFGADS
jgi:protein-S-isoprenylcysteine O-methyltransferase Ste14